VNDYPEYVTRSETAFCTAPGCRHKPPAFDGQADEVTVPRYAVRGSDLCEFHVRRFATVLGELSGEIAPPKPKQTAQERMKNRTPGYVEALQSSLVRKPGSLPSDSSGIRSSTPRDVGELWNPKAAEVLADIRQWTDFLVRTVIQDHPNGRLGSGLALSASTLMNLVVIHRRHTRWLALYPGLGAGLLTDAGAYRSAALRALEASPIRRFPLRGQFCHEPVGLAEGGTILECFGQLVAVVPVHEETLTQKPSEIVCLNNPDHRIPQSEWMAYAHR
jgi:hypothetical protein